MQLECKRGHQCRAGIHHWSDASRPVTVCMCLQLPAEAEQHMQHVQHVQACCICSITTAERGQTLECNAVVQALRESRSTGCCSHCGQQGTASVLTGSVLLRACACCCLGMKAHSCGSILSVVWI